ncbi:malate dehydrogenase [Synechococcus sp. PCC 6312]|uniref:malate dehydrogenase n=1 Tax=Synechococcus sp. (strain ATCC 27167 / PCC 6312) TaxID=195253 RepID=UPI00029EE0C2|nr:malate dehydrogenase [Synechococcus sp. PCC 6312]AFY59449.1 malate dehydrogenase (NAD) [Synechococcus sp. PCC 6312]
MVGQRAKVGIIGAGNVGSTLARRILELDLAHVVLLDVIPGRTQGLALDLNQAQAISGNHSTILGTESYAELAGVDIVVITAGFPRKPGMSREDLLKINGQLVQDITTRAMSQAPNAFLIVVTNPLDVMTHLAWQVSGLGKERVLGMAGILDSARFASFIAAEMGISVRDIRAMVLGGHGDLMVPLPRHTTVNGIPLPELLPLNAISPLIERTQNGGAEIVSFLKSGSAYYAPAAATAEMVAAILEDQHRILPASVYLEGEYGLTEVCMGVPIKLGARGVEQVIELPLTGEELTALQTSGANIRDNIQLLKTMLV